MRFLHELTDPTPLAGINLIIIQLLDVHYLMKMKMYGMAFLFDLLKVEYGQIWYVYDLMVRGCVSFVSLHQEFRVMTPIFCERMDIILIEFSKICVKCC